MTMENYEKKYKNALEWARQVMTGETGFIRKEVEEVFPELAKSEDEGIRKVLVDYFKHQNKVGINTFFGIKVDDILSWLEKQGEQKPITIDIDKMVSKYSHTKDGDFGLPVNCQIRAYRQGINDALNLSLGIKKQGEQKPYGQREECLDCQFNYAGECKGFCVTKKDECEEILEDATIDGNEDGLIAETIRYKNEKQDEKKETLCDKCRKAQPSHSCQDITANGRCYIEGMNTSNKIKPKFQNGQWIVWQNKYYKVNYNDCGYELVDQDGLSTSLEYGTVDENARLWDITKDAKDGDVLVCNEEILLFKSYSVQNRISLYCWYNGQTNNFHNKEVVDTLLTTRNKICPATKEQRDLLFSKMKEAGYIFDFEKKELKKIEQKSATWSEEDENMLEYALDMIEWYSSKNEDKSRLVSDWLKSLKQRIGG